MEDQTRNLNPTPEAKVAMIIWGGEYSRQSGGSMDFWDRLCPDRKARCAMVVTELAERAGFKFQDRQPASKTKGYPFPGTIVQHIFAPEQLKLQDK